VKKLATTGSVGREGVSVKRRGDAAKLAAEESAQERRNRREGEARLAAVRRSKPAFLK
jgi:hypothetical protein